MLMKRMCHGTENMQSKPSSNLVSYNTTYTSASPWHACKKTLFLVAFW
jgi:hypothetical protein